MRESYVHQQAMEKINRFGFREKVQIKSEVEEEEDDDYEIPKQKLNCPQKMAPVSTSTIPIRFSGQVAAIKSLEKCIKLGETFHSFGEVSQAITMYEMKNKVRLTQKYFRRIAANPKPSNKEDYMLTEEERKRFVYRWVDFCCTYFDEILARTDPDDKGASGSTQVLGLAMKECPMRIRFQLRCKDEKDLMISIFKEEHDHVHPTTGDAPQISDLPKKSEVDDVVAPLSNSTSTTSSDLKTPKRPRTQPPSLAPISSLKNLASSVKPETRLGSSFRFLTDSHVGSAAAPLNFRTHLNPSTLIPKPPPLKAMPLLSCNTESPNNNALTNNNNTLSAESVIRNIYLQLCRMQATGFVSDNGLRFATKTPDLVKITSELSGVDASRVSVICRAKRHNDVQKKARPTEDKLQPSLPTEVSNASCSNVPSVRQNNCVIKRVNEKQSKTINANWIDTRNQQSQGSNVSLIDATNNLVNLPLEVIIKSEPEVPFDYYDENDSNSDMDANNDHDDYFSNDQTDTTR